MEQRGCETRGEALSSITRPEISHKTALPLTPPLQQGWGWSQTLLPQPRVRRGEQRPEPRSGLEELPEINRRQQRGRCFPEIKPQLMVFPRAGGCRGPAAHRLGHGSATLPLPPCWLQASGASLFGDIRGYLGTEE